MFILAVFCGMSQNVNMGLSSIDSAYSIRRQSTEILKCQINGSQNCKPSGPSSKSKFDRNFMQCFLFTDILMRPQTESRLCSTNW